MPPLNRSDWPQYLHVGWGPRRNQPCKIFWKKTLGVRCWQTPKFGISTLLVVLTTLSHYRVRRDCLSNAVHCIGMIGHTINMKSLASVRCPSVFRPPGDYSQDCELRFGPIFTKFRTELPLKIAFTLRNRLAQPVGTTALAQPVVKCKRS